MGGAGRRGEPQADGHREQDILLSCPEDAQPTDPLADLYLAESDRRPRQYAVIVTCLVFTVLFLVSLPSERRPAAEAPVVHDLSPLYRWEPAVRERLAPPDPPQREEMPVVVLPVPRFDDVAPVRESTLEPEPEPVEGSAPVFPGPRRPPATRAAAPVREGLTGLTRPRPLREVQPDYPAAALRAGVGGTVVIRAVVDRQGRVKEARVLRGVGLFGLDEAALRAVEARRYSPGLLEGRPVEVLVTIRVSFNPGR